MNGDHLKRLLPAYQPLFELLSRNVDDSMLREIAIAAYGMDVEDHLRELRSIQRGIIPAPMKWEPKEVLEFVRWSNPDGEQSTNPTVNKRGHWMRLFACAVLIRAAIEPENEARFLGEDSTIIQLVQSAMKLGNGVPLAALSFLSWRMSPATTSESDSPLLALAILLLSASQGKCDAELSQFLIANILSEEHAPSELFDDCQQAGVWRDIICQVLIDSRKVKDDLRSLGELLIDSANC